ncbi:glycosyltransferase [uncultured Tateyamaria sp.]|uniref:glycosyltransferase family protein n=1 Tax=uncultured Tateyamaria sp. TaxID=455651 RepID=UPI002616A030|nr:glycosyltransferase [uncultured Tateyamaria sp.]
MNVMIVVTHLLGTGHLARALTLGRAFAGRGHSVTIVSGGTPVPHFDTTGLEVIQLPPVRSNGIDFTKLLDENGALVDTAHMDTRLAALTGALTTAAPDVLITELFPFGRRILRDEFQQLLAQAHTMHPRPLVLASVRDILAPPSKPSKAAFADTLVADFYDGVLVHSDADLVPLDRSWPVTERMASVLHYTGFVAPPPPGQDAKTHGEILVSAGGGNVGDAVFETALTAARQTPHWRWRCIVGGGQDRVAQVAATAPDNMAVEAPRPDFRVLMQGASASVSMCGYNTAMDILQTGVPAVFIPFDDGGEVEQGLRAAALAALPAIGVVPQSDLTAEGLITALSTVITQPARPPRTDGMDGATQTVEIVDRLLQGHNR